MNKKIKKKYEKFMNVYDEITEFDEKYDLLTEKQSQRLEDWIEPFVRRYY